MERLESALGLGSELGDQRAILYGVVLAHGWADGDAAWVHHDDALDALVGVDAVNGLLDFLGLYRGFLVVPSSLPLYNFEFNYSTLFDKSWKTKPQW